MSRSQTRKAGFKGKVIHKPEPVDFQGKPFRVTVDPEQIIGGRSRRKTRAVHVDVDMPLLWKRLREWVRVL